MAKKQKKPRKSASRRTSKTPVKIYSYGCPKFSADLQRVVDECQKANFDSYNQRAAAFNKQVVDDTISKGKAHDDYRQAYREHRELKLRLEDLRAEGYALRQQTRARTANPRKEEIKALRDEVEKSLEKLKAANKAALAEHEPAKAELSRRIDVAMTALGKVKDSKGKWPPNVLPKVKNPIIKVMMEEEKWPADWKELQNLGIGRKAEAKEVANGIHWRSSNLISAAITAAIKAPTRYGRPLKAKRHRDLIRCCGGQLAGLNSIDDVVNGRNEALKIILPQDDAWRVNESMRLKPVRSKTVAIAQIEIFPDGKAVVLRDADGNVVLDEKKRPVLAVNARGKSTRAKPVVIEVPFVMHRPLPRNGKITYFWLHGKRCGVRTQYSLQLTIESEEFSSSLYAEKAAEYTVTRNDQHITVPGLEIQIGDLVRVPQSPEQVALYRDLNRSAPTHTVQVVAKSEAQHDSLRLDYNTSVSGLAVFIPCARRLSDGNFLYGVVATEDREIHQLVLPYNPGRAGHGGYGNLAGRLRRFGGPKKHSEELTNLPDRLYNSVRQNVVQWMQRHPDRLPSWIHDCNIKQWKNPRKLLLVAKAWLTGAEVTITADKPREGRLDKIDEAFGIIDPKPEKFDESKSNGQKMEVKTPKADPVISQERVVELWDRWHTCRHQGDYGRKRREREALGIYHRPSLWPHEDHYEVISNWLASEGVTDPVEVILLYLEWWRRQNQHVSQEIRNGYHKAVECRNELFAMDAQRFLVRYKHMAVLDVNFAAKARRKTVDEELEIEKTKGKNAVTPKPVRSYRQLIAPGEAKLTFLQVFGSRAGKIDPALLHPDLDPKEADAEYLRDHDIENSDSESLDSTPTKECDDKFTSWIIRTAEKSLEIFSEQLGECLTAVQRDRDESEAPASGSVCATPQEEADEESDMVAE